MHIDFNIMREEGFYKKVVKEREKNIKKINKGGWKLAANCPFCFSSETLGKKFEDATVPFNICDTCGAIYATKIPVHQNSGEYSCDDIHEIIESRDEKKREYRKERFASERVQLIEKYLLKPLKSASLIDVGCNTGFFLEVAKPKFKNTYGFEPNGQMAEYVHEKFGIRVFKTLPNYESSGSFDVVTLFDVIEHVENPMALLKNCRTMLKRDGIIVIFTPQWKSFGFDLLGKESTQYYPSEHLHFMSKNTVDFIADNLNMQIDLCETQGMDIYDVMAYMRDIAKTQKMFNNSVLDGIQEGINELGYGNHMRIVLRRKD